MARRYLFLLLFSFNSFFYPISATAQTDKEDIVSVLNPEIIVNEAFIFGWNSFTIEIESSNPMIIASLLENQFLLKVILIDGECKEIPRQTISSKRIRRAVDKNFKNFKKRGGMHINKIDENHLNIKVYKKLRTKSPFGGNFAKYMLKEGSYHLYIEFIREGKIYLTKPIPFIVI